jgi:hypothetical protein
MVSRITFASVFVICSSVLSFFQRFTVSADPAAFCFRIYVQRSGYMQFVTIANILQPSGRRESARTIAAKQR